jgi:hypothetical protein
MDPATLSLWRQAQARVTHCRLFHRRDEFEAEVALYRNPVLRRVLPKLRRASDNANGAVRSRSGYAFPPYFVLERGMSMRDWRRQERTHHEFTMMVERIALLLVVLHAADYVHRDTITCCTCYIARSGGCWTWELSPARVRCCMHVVPAWREHTCALRVLSSCVCVASTRSSDLA